MLLLTVGIFPVVAAVTVAVATVGIFPAAADAVGQNNIVRGTNNQNGHSNSVIAMTVLTTHSAISMAKKTRCR